MNKKTIGTIALIAGISSIFIDGDIAFAILLVPISLMMLFDKNK